MKIIICDNKQEIGKKAAEIILNEIKRKPESVIGFATGSSPIPTYESLIDDFKKNKTDWTKVSTFNLDEYVGLNSDHPQSYRHFMNQTLFKHINLNLANTNVPSGVGDVDKNISDYESKISSMGGIDLQLLGIGINGHIAFNEPGTSFSSKTRIENLTDITIQANSRFFASMSEVPKTAITMGIGTIMKAKKIILVADGTNKAMAISQLVDGKYSPEWPCTALQKHKDFTLIIDRLAASKLK
jgi:glucosamine-6-phosphate deaminase